MLVATHTFETILLEHAGELQKSGDARDAQDASLIVELVDHAVPKVLGIPRSPRPGKLDLAQWLDLDCVDKAIALLHRPDFAQEFAEQFSILRKANDALTGPFEPYMTDIEKTIRSDLDSAMFCTPEHAECAASIAWLYGKLEASRVAMRTIYRNGVKDAEKVILEVLRQQIAMRRAQADGLPDGPDADTLRDHYWSTAGAIVFAETLAANAVYQFLEGSAGMADQGSTG
jgi:hypothetical protein